MTHDTGALIAIGVFLIGHLGTAIWFGAKVAGKVDRLINDNADLTKAVKTMTTDAVRVSTKVEQLSSYTSSLAEALKELATSSTRISVLEQRVMTLEQDVREARMSVRTLLGHSPSDQPERP